MKTRTLLLGAALAVLAAPASGSVALYKADASHSSVEFSIRHFTGSMMGRFGEFAGTIRLDKGDLAQSSVDFKVLAGSVDTAEEKRDTHLRSEDFFDSQRFSSLRFHSTAVQPKDDTHLDVTGELTIRGVTRTITVPVQLLGFVGSPAGERVGFESNFVVDRKAFGLDWNRIFDGAPMLGDDVNVQVLVEARRVEMPELLLYPADTPSSGNTLPQEPGGGAIQVRCTAQPHAIPAGGQTQIAVLAFTSQNQPISGANVLLESGGGWFSTSGATAALGQTDAGGGFRTSWRAPDPAAAGYSISVQVTKDGFTEGRGECLVPIQ